MRGAGVVPIMVLLASAGNGAQPATRHYAAAGRGSPTGNAALVRRRARRAASVGAIAAADTAAAMGSMAGARSGLAGMAAAAATGWRTTTGSRLRNRRI